jgi:hypothetical protein
MLSQQPRFKELMDSPQDIFSSLLRMYHDKELDEPQYMADSRTRDRWLTNFVKKEPILRGIVASIADIDKNRGWKVTGGRNQVQRVTDMFHDFSAAPGLRGWRSSMSMVSHSFWSTDMGAVVELGTEGKGGPVRELYTVDPVRCALTGKNDYPLRYYPKIGNMQKWAEDEYFRVVSMPSYQEENNGLGDCAVARCVRLAKLMIGVYTHDEESLGARAARGLLLLTGLNQTQWDNAMKSRDASLDADGMKYFEAVAVLASLNQHADGKFLRLSELPAGFNLRDWTDMLVYGYALCFGYDPSEFWPVQYGALGRGNETQIQDEKATEKGKLECVLGFEEQMQRILPDSIQYEFDERNERGELVQASVKQAWANVVKTMYEAQDAQENMPLITNEEARVLLAEYGIIPSTWSPTADVIATDTTGVGHPADVESPEEAYPQPVDGTEQVPPADTRRSTGAGVVEPTKALNMLIPKFKTTKMSMLRDRLMLSSKIRRAAEKFPTEPIVEYSWPAKTTIVIWDRGETLLDKTIF